MTNRTISKVLHRPGVQAWFTYCSLWYGNTKWMTVHLNYAFESTAKLARRPEGRDNGCGKEGKDRERLSVHKAFIWPSSSHSVQLVWFSLLISPFKVGAGMYNFRSIEENLTLHLGGHYLVSLCILMKYPKHLPWESSLILQLKCWQSSAIVNLRV